MNKRTVIIGGIAGGATTAARLRRRDESMEIILFERGEYISYANCGLPYYIGDVISSRDALLVQTPEAMRDKYKIDVRTSNEVTRILPEQKKVQVKNLKTNAIYEESYDNLVLATGSSPFRPTIPGIDAENIFVLWTIPDMDKIKAYINDHHCKKAAVIGGGFIGLEMADNLKEAGLQVSLLEMQNQVMAPLDYEMANLLHENIRMNGVELIFGDGVQSFHKTPGGTTIELSSGNRIDADIILLSIGVRPNSELAAEAGIKLNKRNGVIVNDYLETSIKDIYAVGDVIEVNHFITKERTMIPLAGPANKQARILADNLSGDHKKYDGTMGTAVSKVFDLAAASVGLNEKQLQGMDKIKGIDYHTVLINQRSHAGYFPGATPLTLKMIFDPSGKILGGQIVGQDGVDKRIDTLATTIRTGGTIYDLEELELGYAPPFSSAKDPVNMLGFTAENVLKGMVSFVSWQEVDEILKSDLTAKNTIVLDVSEDVERMVFSIAGSSHIPLGQIRDRIGELDKKKRIITYCSIGVRSYNAARILMQNGFTDVAVLAGGTSFYKSMHHTDSVRRETNSGAEKVTATSKPSETRDKINAEDVISNQEYKILDCTGLQCPGPIMKVHQAIEGMDNGNVLKVSATDMGFANDINSWCRRTGNTLLKSERKNKDNIVYIQKGTDEPTGTPIAKPIPSPSLPQGKSIIVFSGDLDKVLASFVIANGAAAMGRPVTMFFTFWGLNALRKSEAVKVQKSMTEKMFGKMMPRGVSKLKLSKMNMAGMGTAMMKKVMKDKNVNSLEDLMKQAMASGIKLVACTMSMDIMGITKEELLDGIEYAGVASYLGDAEESNVNLFI